MLYPYGFRFFVLNTCGEYLPANVFDYFLFFLLVILLIIVRLLIMRRYYFPLLFNLIRDKNGNLWMKCLESIQPAEMACAYVPDQLKRFLPPVVPSGYSLHGATISFASRHVRKKYLNRQAKTQDWSYSPCHTEAKKIFMIPMETLTAVQCVLPLQSYRAFQ